MKLVSGRPTDQPTDRPTDQPTDIATYRAAIAAKKWNFPLRGGGSDRPIFH